jgi:hypothetical protein
MENNTPAQVKRTQITDLIDDFVIVEVAKLDELRTLLNNNPPDAWVKEHPYIKGHKYIPIDKVEFLLDKIFKRYRIEVIKTGMLMNAVEVTIRLHYFNVVTNEWDYHDGVGAVELQTEKGTGALKMDMSNVNRGAVSIALPVAKSYAIKDAADHIGRVFGRDLNRKDIIKFTTDANLQDRANRFANLINESNSDENE